MDNKVSGHICKKNSKRIFKLMGQVSGDICNKTPNISYNLMDWVDSNPIYAGLNLKPKP